MMIFWEWGLKVELEWNKKNTASPVTCPGEPKGRGSISEGNENGQGQEAERPGDLGEELEVSEAKFEIPFRVRSNMRIAVQPVWFDRVNAADESSDTVFSYGRTRHTCPLICLILAS